MNIFYLILGLFLLLVGHNLFWLSVGIMGFLVGVDFATALLSPNDGLSTIVIAFLFGLLGAVFAVAFQWVRIILMGFLGGGYFFMSLISIGGSQPQNSWAVFLLGGIIGVLLMLIALDWALIMISSLLGSMLILQSFYFIAEPLRSLAFLGLIVCGVLIQIQLYPKKAVLTKGGKYV